MNDVLSFHQLKTLAIKVFQISEPSSNVAKRASVFKCFSGLNNGNHSDCLIGHFLDVMNYDKVC